MPLDSIQFTALQTSLTERCGDKIGKIVAWLNENPGVDVTLAGHVAGSTADARALAERRVGTVRAALISGGLEATRIQNSPAPSAICTASTEDCERANRSVDILVARRL